MHTTTFDRELAALQGRIMEFEQEPFNPRRGHDVLSAALSCAQVMMGLASQMTPAELAQFMRGRHVREMRTRFRYPPPPPGFKLMRNESDQEAFSQCLQAFDAALDKLQAAQPTRPSDTFLYVVSCERTSEEEQDAATEVLESAKTLLQRLENSVSDVAAISFASDIALHGVLLAPAANLGREDIMARELEVLEFNDRVVEGAQAVKSALSAGNREAAERHAQSIAFQYVVSFKSVLAATLARTLSVVITMEFVTATIIGIKRFEPEVADEKLWNSLFSSESTALRVATLMRESMPAIEELMRCYPSMKLPADPREQVHHIGLCRKALVKILPAIIAFWSSINDKSVLPWLERTLLRDLQLSQHVISPSPAPIPTREG